MVKSKYTLELEKKYGEKLKDKKKETLSKFFDIEMKYLDEVYDRGLAAARNTGTRASVKSDDQWARARMNKFILNVVDARDGKKINKGAGEDGDVVEKAIGKKIIVLKKSKSGDAKNTAKFGNKTLKFGNKKYRDFVLLHDKKSKYYEPDKTEREKVKSNYRQRHSGDKLNKVSRGSLSYFLLWNKPTLKESIKDYEEKFDVIIKI